MFKDQQDNSYEDRDDNQRGADGSKRVHKQVEFRLCHDGGKKDHPSHKKCKVVIDTALVRPCHHENEQNETDGYEKSKMSRDIVLDEDANNNENETPKNAEQHPPPHAVLVGTTVDIHNRFEFGNVHENHQHNRKWDDKENE